ncbi:MAG: AAA family ATPase [Gammaproteobacteria bacterium]|nr:AAA family ATPase [Gammaproteobacteria bacterium]MDH5801050.1 AAA family ATPase [Gammaproteobacteria bacterium]
MAVVKELPARLLYTSCDLKQLKFSNTDQLLCADEALLGQSRALEAMQFGVEINKDGYNLFVHGPSGVGKATLVNQFLAQYGPSQSASPDWCYVNNFSQTNKPSCLSLPAGQAIQLKSDMLDLVKELQHAIPNVFETEEYHSQVQLTEEKFISKRERAISSLEKEATRLKIKLVRTRTGFTLAPVKGEKVISPEEFQLLPDSEKAQYEKGVSTLQEKISYLVAQDPRLQRELRAELGELNKKTVTPVISHLIDELIQRYVQLPQVVQYLTQVQQDIIENVADFSRQDDERNPLRPQTEMFSPYRRYAINVLVDNQGGEGAPIIYEDNPTYQNLIGRVEHYAQFGTLMSDFMQIKPGALHKANGGYLILEARKVLSEPFAWEGLKRALRAKEIRIQALGEMYGILNTVSVEPQTIPLDVKVVLLGDRMYYYLLQSYDPDFDELFKVAVDFDVSIQRTEENLSSYAQLIANLARKQQLKAFNKKAVARLIEQASRNIEDSTKLSTHMGSMSDLLCEADYYARKEEAKVVSDVHVQKALDQKTRRSDRYRKAIWDEIQSGTIKIKTQGERIGCVNGLSVIHLGDFVFGQPALISASVHMGDGHIIDIEREVELGGAIHSKGVLILSAYISGRYARTQPLALSASIAFEQSYGMVDGDSASVAELCALLSAIAELPLKHSLAVTGSVNQQGEVQAIGGVNEKIEGFFDVCQLGGLSGDQGVLIPKSNVSHLMLRQDVIAAVKAGQFHVYAVESVDEALTLLSGQKAGVMGKDGMFTKGSANRKIQDKLNEFSRLKQDLSK